MKARYSLLMLIIGILLRFGPVAYGSPGWHLSSSSFTTNVTESGNGGNTPVFWYEAATASASYSVGNTNLSVTDSGTAWIWAVVDPDHGGTFDYSGTSDFEANAHASWVPNGEGGGPEETITTSGDFSGYFAVTNFFEGGCDYIVGIAISDTAGTVGVGLSADGGSGNVGSFTNFANLTNSTNSVLSSVNASFSNEFSTNSSGSDGCNYWYSSESYADFSISWTNSYTTASGLTSLSAACSVAGTATAIMDVEYVGPNNAGGSAGAGVSMSGTVSVTLALSDDGG